jgi:hypothetical protein
MTRTSAMSAQELHAIQTEGQTETIRFRVTPSLKRHFEVALRDLGVKDMSSFARGAFLNAIELAKLGQDPQWRKFIAKVNEGPAKAILGHGLSLPEAVDIEGRGRERKGVKAADLKRALARLPKGTKSALK